MLLGKRINMLIEDFNCTETNLSCLEIWLKIRATSVVESTLDFSVKQCIKSVHFNVKCNL